jgi:hypothetical protein
MDRQQERRMQLAYSSPFAPGVDHVLRLACLEDQNVAQKGSMPHEQVAHGESLMTAAAAIY